MPQDPGQIEFELALIWISTLVIVGISCYILSRCTRGSTSTKLAPPPSLAGPGRGSCCIARPRVSVIATIAAFTCMWFSTSLTIVNVNRFVFGYMDHRLAFPLTITLMHMLIKGVLAAAYVLFSNEYNTPELLLLPPIERIKARWTRLRSTHRIGKREFFLYICPIGVVTALDVWLSNLALKSVDVSVYTTAKGTSLAWNLGLSLLFGLMSPAPKVVISVIALLAGATLASMKPVGADPLGVVFTLCAACCSATRWVVSERMMVRRNVREAPSAILLAAMIAPASVLTLIIPASLEIKTMVDTQALSEPTDLNIFLATIFGGGLCALFLVVSEIQLVKLTSALTISVIGYTKDLSAIILSILVFHDVLSVENWCGVLLASASMLSYSIFRSRGEGNVVKTSTSTLANGEKTAASISDTAMPDSPMSASGSNRRNMTSGKGGGKGRERSNSSFWGANDSVVDTTGFGSPEREVSGGGKSTFTGSRLNFVHLNLESDSEEDEEGDDEDDNNDSYVGNKFGIRGGRIKLQEKASLLSNTGGGGGGGEGGDNMRSKESATGKAINDNHSHSNHHNYHHKEVGFKDKQVGDDDDDTSNNDGDDDENDIGLGVLSPVTGGEGDRHDSIFDEDEALDRELHDASGLPSKSTRPSSSSSLSSSSTSAKNPSVFFGLLEQSTRTLPLGKGRPHPQDRKNAAAAKALREAEARRKAAAGY